MLLIISIIYKGFISKLDSSFVCLFVECFFKYQN